jgi:hypothetical protein
VAWVYSPQAQGSRSAENLITFRFELQSQHKGLLKANSWWSGKAINRPAEEKETLKHVHKCFKLKTRHMDGTWTVTEAFLIPRASPAPTGSHPCSQPGERSVYRRIMIEGVSLPPSV